MNKKTFLILNPNTTTSITDGVVACVNKHCRKSVDVVGVTASHGPSIIDTKERFVAGEDSTMHTWNSWIESQAAGEIRNTGVLLACFGDPGIERLRRFSQVPVVGLLESSIITMANKDEKFAIVTCGEDWVSIIDEKVKALGAKGKYVGAFSIPIRPAEYLAAPDSHGDIINAVLLKISRLGAASVIQGGAVFSEYPITPVYGICIVDPIACAVADLQRIMGS